MALDYTRMFDTVSKRRESMIFNGRTRQALMEFEALEQEQIDWRNKLLIANLERDMARGLADPD
jgi:hypothetical protein